MAGVDGLFLGVPGGGALTPTEVLASMRAGADAVKLFPVGSVGARVICGRCASRCRGCGRWCRAASRPARSVSTWPAISSATSWQAARAHDTDPGRRCPHVHAQEEPVDVSHDRGYPLRSVKLIFRSAECMIIYEPPAG